jgi:hypothetical protein
LIDHVCFSLKQEAGRSFAALRRRCTVWKLGVTIGLGGFWKLVASWEMMDFARWEVRGKLLRKYDFENSFWRLMFVGYCFLVLYYCWVLSFSEGIVARLLVFVAGCAPCLKVSGTFRFISPSSE